MELRFRKYSLIQSEEGFHGRRQSKLAYNLWIALHNCMNTATCIAISNLAIFYYNLVIDLIRLVQTSFLLTTASPKSGEIQTIPKHWSKKLYPFRAI